MSADRVFGLLERDIKNKKEITCEEDYQDIFKKLGTLKLILKKIEHSWTGRNNH